MQTTRAIVRVLIYYKLVEYTGWNLIVSRGMCAELAN